MSLRPINAKQQTLYWRAWGACRRALIEDCGMTSKEAGEYRHIMHTQALGEDKSHTKLSNKDLDKVLAVFRARSQPNDAAEQIRQQEQPLKRGRKVLQNLADELQLSSNYIEGMARRICKKPLERCYESDLSKLIAALNFHKKRHLANAETSTEDPF